MRIVMLHHDPAHSVTGAAHMAVRTAAALAERGHAVALAGTGAGAAVGAGSVQPLGPRLPTSLDDLVRLTGWAPDVVHVTDLADPTAGWRGLALARAAGCPLAVTPATHPALWTDPTGALVIARVADVVFVLTPGEGAALTLRGLAPERLVRLGQGPQLVGAADPEGFRVAVEAKGPLVLFLGRRLPSKGYQHLEAAAPQIVAHHPDAVIVMAGPGFVGSAGSSDGPIRVVGQLGEAAKHSALAAADLLVLPTVADAFPLVFVEAWWCGTPVVSGPFSGVYDVVCDGVDGVVVPAEPEAVAGAITALLADPERLRAMGRAGRRRAEREFSWATVAAAAERGYRRAAERHAIRSATTSLT